MDVDEITTRLVRRFGESVADWCAAAPELADRMAACWGLTLGDEYPAGASSIAIRCTWPDGTPAALKLSPQREFMVEQANMLRAFAVSGRVPAVLAVDPDEGAVVMEGIQPGTEVDDLPVPPSPMQWADLLTALLQAEIPGGATVLRERGFEFFDRIGKRLADPAIGAHISQAMWNRAMERCEALLRTEPTAVALHGDLHLSNVLDGGPRGLVAIDPKICVGDPCFDAVDYVLDAAGQTGADTVDSRCEQLAAAYGMDGDRLYAWSRAIAPVIAVSRVAVPERQPAATELLAMAS
jgi:streptomycin 6-kinase